MSINNISDTAVWLIGFRLNPDSDDADIYTAILHGEIDKPLMIDDQIIFSKQLETLAHVIDSVPNVNQSISPLHKVDLICDVAEALYLITAEDIDTSATIINFLNILFDLVRATKLSMPANYKNILYSFADHLTFSQEFKRFLEEKKITRGEIRDAILWSIGTIMVKTKML